jgi:uncharacterized phiE125 gp8 family phage protein
MATQPPSPPPEPLSVEEVKLNLRVDVDDEDALIEGLISVAREHVEDYTGLVLTPRTITETAATLGHWIDLAAWPVTNVLEIRYPLDSVMAALPGSAWAISLRRRPVRILPVAPFWGLPPASWGLAPSARARTTLPVEIDVQAGYGTPAEVPFTIKQAMHLLIAHLYMNRGAAEVGTRAAAVEVPFGVEALLRRWRLVQV